MQHPLRGGHVEVLAGAGVVAGDQSGEDANGCVPSATGTVGHRHTRKERAAIVASGGGVEGARHRYVVEVVAGTRCVGTALPVASERAVDDSLIGGSNARVADSQAVGHAWGEESPR